MSIIVSFILVICLECILLSKSFIKSLLMIRTIFCKRFDCLRWIIASIITLTIHWTFYRSIDFEVVLSRKFKREMICLKSFWFLWIWNFFYWIHLIIFCWFIPLWRSWNDFQLRKIIILNFYVNLYVSISSKVINLNPWHWFVFITNFLLFITLGIIFIILR